MTTELEEKATAVTVVERAALALGADKHETELVSLSKKYKDIVEIKNPAGRQQCHAAAMELSNARIATTKTGETAREDANAFQKAVIAEVKRRIAIISAEEARLLALRDAWDDAREAEKIAKALVESQRITKIRLTIDTIRHVPTEFIGKSSAEIGAAADDLSEQVLSLDFYAEYAGEAQAERDAAVKQLRTMQEAMRAHEEAAAELARQAEADRIERERVAEANRIESKRLADLAAEIEHQAQLAREKQAESDRVARQRREAADRQAQADRDEADRIAEAKHAAAQKILDDQAADLKRQQDAADEVARLAREAESAVQQLEADHAEALTENAHIDAEVAKAAETERIQVISEPVEMVSIPKKEYEQLLRDSAWLQCLEQAGVDNWMGFDDAREIMREKAA